MLAAVALAATAMSSMSSSLSSSSLRGSVGPLFYVDEVSCIGCNRCVEVAGETFALEPSFGRARVVVQGGSPFEDVRAAIRTCPSECIHQVTFGELGVLESWRHLHLDGVQRAHATSRLVGSSSPRPWWQPLLEAGSGAGAGGDWHPIITQTRTETKATVDFMGVPKGSEPPPLSIADEDANMLKYELPRTAQLRSRSDFERVLREHSMVVASVVFLFTMQGIEILTNHVYV
jgi:ferredoxin